MPYTGKGSYIYIKSEGGTFGFAAAAIGAAGHIPVGPLLNITELPESRYRESVNRTIDSEVANLIYTELMEKGEATMEFIYKDPFLMAMAFHHKVVDTPWTGTNDDITMDFSAVDHRESFMIHIHIHDSVNPIDATFYGCQINSYRWKLEAPGKILKEIVRVSSINNKEDVQAMVCVNGFHDQRWGDGVGGWGDWDPDAPYHATQITPTVGSPITSVKAKAVSIGFEYPKKAEHSIDSLITTVEYDDHRVHFFEIEGIQLTDADLVEIRKTYANKAKSTIKMAYGDATKYMQFTNGYLTNLDKLKLPPTNQALTTTLRWEGGEDSVISVALRYSIATDPDPMITD